MKLSRSALAVLLRYKKLVGTFDDGEYDDALYDDSVLDSKTESPASDFSFNLFPVTGSWPGLTGLSDVTLSVSSGIGVF